MAEGRDSFGDASDGNVSIDRGDVYKVSIRVPPFWPEEPEIWFAQVEGQFAINKITNDLTKFNYVIGQLENQYSREVKDIITRPPKENRYEKLKTELIKRLSPSNEKKLKQLLMHEELGDRKPSSFLRHLQSLAGVDVPDDVLKIIWISRLPNRIQTVLAGQPGSTPVEDLADLADRVVDIDTSSPMVASMGEAVPSSVLSNLTKEIAELRRQFQSLVSERSGRPRSRPSQSGRNRSSSRQQRSQSSYRKFPLCWYHSKFAEKANKCVRPCDFKAENFKGGR